MKKEDLIAKLTEKKEKLVKETEKYDDREFMPRTLLFTTLRNQVRTYRKVSSIECALSLINGTHINTLHDELLKRADSIYLSERREVIRSVMEHSLPICKKQVMAYI